MTAAGIPALLEPIQERLDAATPGPWNVDRNFPFTSDLVGIFAPNSQKYVLQVEDQDDVDDPTSAADAAFIAHAPTDTARLLAAVKAVTKLHQPEHHYLGANYKDTCAACRETWPCLTVSAVEAALRGEA